jgi:hypothetical protein
VSIHKDHLFYFSGEMLKSWGKKSPCAREIEMPSESVPGPRLPAAARMKNHPARADLLLNWDTCESLCTQAVRIAKPARAERL